MNIVGPVRIMWLNNCNPFPYSDSPEVASLLFHIALNIKWILERGLKEKYFPTEFNN